MKTHLDAHLRLAVGACVLSVLGIGCEQPTPRCSVATGEFAVRYVKKSGNCEDLPGETLSLHPYYPPRSKSDASPNFAKASIALQPSQITGVLHAVADAQANMVQASVDPTDKPYALGAFTSDKPGRDDYCSVPTLSVARVRSSAIAAYQDRCRVSHPAQAAADLRYEFKDISVYNTPGAYGTQLKGTLIYTTPTCTAEYDIAGVYPAIACNTSEPAPIDPMMSEDAATADAGAAAPVADDAGAGAAADIPEDCEPPQPDPGPQVPDDTACGEGSGISPEFAVTCDPTLLMCVLKDAPPSLR